MGFSDVVLWVLVVALPCTIAHDFFGGTISFEPILTQDGVDLLNTSTILWKVRHRTAWNRSDEHNFCDEATINSQVLVGDDHVQNTWIETSSSKDDIPLGTGQYICSSFSKEEDWTSGENIFIANFSTPETYIYQYACCWIFGLLTYDDYYGLFYDRGYLVEAFWIAIQRSDNATLNSSPVTAAVPLMRLRTGCRYSIRIPMEDPDGDITRCRVARGPECEDGCVGRHGLDFELDQLNCVLDFLPLDNIQGLHPVSLVVGDFATPVSPPLSLVTLSFVVDVVHGVGGQCAAYVAFEKQTVADGTCFGIEPNATFETTIYVQEYSCSSLIDVVLSAPVGMRKSDITGPSPHKQMTITWTPKPYQYGYNILCFQASDDYAMYTEQRCITLVAGAVVPQPLPDSALFNGSNTVSFTVNSFSIEFENDIFRPSVPRNITIWKTGVFVDFLGLLFDSPELVVAFDTSSDDYVNITGTNLTFMLPAWIQLEEFSFYAIEIGFGAVVSKQPCSGGGVPFPGLNNWKFRTVPFNYCGDAIVETGEECDDGNELDGDGCHFNCTVEFAYRCNETDSRSVCIRNQCQDGFVFDPEEECDDGNSVNGDGCDETCSIEVGYDCNTTNTGLSVCFSLCSNDILDSEIEECDNGINSLAGIDGCNDTTCSVLNLWTCSSQSGTASQCEHVSVDFDSSNNATTSRDVYYTDANEIVWLADPRLLNANMFGDTEWLRVQVNLTGVNQLFSETVVYNPDAAFLASRITQDEVLIALSVGNQAGDISIAGQFKVLVLTRQAGKPTNLTAVLLSLFYQHSNPSDFDSREAIVTVIDYLNQPSPGSIITIHYIGMNAEPPVVMAIDGPAAFEEDSVSPVSLGRVTVSDPDHPVYKMVSASISLLVPDLSPHEWLDVNVTVKDISVLYDNVTGILHLTGIAQTEDYQLVLSSALYFNGGEVGRLSNRTVTYTVSDGLHSGSDIRLLVLVNNNDVPTLTVAGSLSSELLYTEGDPPSSVHNVEARDPDDGLIHGALISLDRSDSEDSITVNRSFAQEEPVVTISVQQNENKTIIELSGSASDTKYSHLLSSVAFQNSNSRPGNPSPMDRLISMSVSDGELESSQVFIAVFFSLVNDRPIMQLTGEIDKTTFPSEEMRRHYVNFTEDGIAVKLLPVNMTIFDVDSTAANGTTVLLTRALDGQDEKICFNRTLSANLGIVRKSETWLNSTTLEVVLVGEAPLSAYKEVLLTFYYVNMKTENPATGVRAVFFTIFDAQGAASDPVTVDVTVQERNDEPIVDLGVGIGANDSILFMDGEEAGVEIVSHAHRLRLLLPDSPAISRISVQLKATGGELDAHEFVYVVGNLPASLVYRPSQDGKSLVLSGDAPTEVYIKALQCLRYINAENEPTTFVFVNNTVVAVSRMIVLNVVDSGLHGLPAATTTARVSVDIEMVNDNAPVVTVNLSPDDCHPNSVSKRSVSAPGFRWSWADQQHIEKLEVVRAELHGIESSHVAPESKLFIQFSSDTNTPYVTNSMHLHQMLELLPDAIHQSDHFGYWEEADLLVIVFPNGIEMEDSAQLRNVFVRFPTLEVGGHEQSLCRHRICSDGEVQRPVVGTYKVDVHPLSSTQHRWIYFHRSP